MIKLKQIFDIQIKIIQGVKVMKNVFKILAVILLGLSVASCELFDPEGWRDAERDAEEKGRECYRRYDGTVYCRDKDGNRVY